MKLAFLIWNSFQLLHFTPLLRALPEALLFIEIRKKSQPINGKLLESLSNKIVYINQTDVAKNLDGVVEVLVCQTVFQDIWQFKKTKIAMLQYGYAKEPHNYGAWRSFADLNLVYGEYAKDKIGYFSPVSVVGCPRYDGVYCDNNKNNDKPTILYAPSWGELSSYPYYIEMISKLTDKYHIIVKLHHNMILLNEREKQPSRFENITYYGQDDDILSLILQSDIVISDYSGAIFDAIYFDKPLILLDIPNLASTLIDENSLEIQRRHEIGKVVQNVDELESQINNCLQNPIFPSKNLKDQLFLTTQSATTKAIDALELLANGKFQRNQQQKYIQQMMIELYMLKSEKAKKRKKFLGIL